MLYSKWRNYKSSLQLCCCFQHLQGCSRARNSLRIHAQPRRAHTVASASSSEAQQVCSYLTAFFQPVTQTALKDGITCSCTLYSIAYMCMQPSEQPSPEDAVQAAFQKVTEAVQAAEQQLHKIEELPSARMPRQVCQTPACLAHEHMLHTSAIFLSCHQAVCTSCCVCWLVHLLCPVATGALPPHKSMTYMLQHMVQALCRTAEMCRWQAL